MIRLLAKKTLGFQAAFVVGMLASADGARAENFSDIARNINDSIAELPGLISGISYVLGLLMGVMGILKLKDHVENPTQTPMKEGAVRLAAGGALFGLPIVVESMLNTIGTTGTVVRAPTLSKAEFNVR